MHIPPSKGLKISILLCLFLAAVAHLFSSIFFQRDLATSWEGVIPHFCLALLSVVGAIAGTHGAVYFGRRGQFAPLVASCALLVACSGLTAISATGFYSAESRRAAKGEEALEASAALDGEHIASLKQQITALGGATSGAGDSQRLVQLRQQRAELVQQREAFAEKNIISAGVKPTQAKIEAVDSEIAQEQAAALASQGTLAKANSDRLSALQSELSAAIASAKMATTEAPKNVSSADALFESLGHNWGMPAETVRAKFLFWQPIILEIMQILLSLISAFMSPAGMIGNEPAKEGRGEKREATPETKREIIPMPKDPEIKETSHKKATLEEYVNKIFEDWTPENRKLVGKDIAGKSLGLNRHETTKHHLVVRTSPHYRIDSRKQSWGVWTETPKTKEEAIKKFIESIK